MSRVACKERPQIDGMTSDASNRVVPPGRGLLLPAAHTAT
jgi:hypothetical protein